MPVATFPPPCPWSGLLAVLYSYTRCKYPLDMYFVLRYQLPCSRFSTPFLVPLTHHWYRYRWPLILAINNRCRKNGHGFRMEQAGHVCKNILLSGFEASIPKKERSEKVEQAVALATLLTDKSHWGVIRVEGEDRLRFLHSQGTNAFQGVAKGELIYSLPWLLRRLRSINSIIEIYDSTICIGRRFCRVFFAMETAN